MKEYEKILRETFGDYAKMPESKLLALDCILYSGYRHKTHSIDTDVYLPSKGFNLQRPLVWSMEQKKKLIESILIPHRYIPPITALRIYSKGSNGEDVFEIIDGKQRLTTIIDFMDEKFSWEGLYCKDIDNFYRMTCNKITVNLTYLSTREESDELKINLFKLLNFGGTPQDSEHLKKLG